METSQSWIANIAILNKLLAKEPWYNTFWAKFSGQVDISTDDNGNKVTVDTTPFIWQVENREAFKEMGSVFASLFKMQRLPMQHYITVNSDERQIASGNKYYVPVPSLDLSVEIPTDDATQELGANFMAWIDRQNTSIMEKWKEKVDAKKRKLERNK